MKSAITVLAITASLMGLGTVASMAQNTERVPAPEQARDENRPDNRRAAREQRPRNGIWDRKKAARNAEKRREEALKQRTEAERRAAAARRNSEESGKTGDAKKAAESATAMRGDAEKEAKALDERMKELAEDRSRAKAELQKNAEALRNAERKVAELDMAWKRLEGQKKARHAMDIQREAALQSRRDTEMMSQQRAAMDKLRGDLHELSRKVELLSLEVSRLRGVAKGTERGGRE